MTTLAPNETALLPNNTNIKVCVFYHKISPFTSFDRFYMIAALMLCAISLIGTIFSFILMSSKKYANRSFSIYFRFLAISDCICIFSMCSIEFDYWLIEGLGIEINWKWMHFFDMLVTLMYGIEDMTKIMSAWFLVALTTDRFLSIIYPAVSYKYCRKSRARSVCCFIIALAFFIEIVAIVTFKNSHNVTYKFEELQLDENDFEYVEYYAWSGKNYTFVPCLFDVMIHITDFITGYFIFMNMILCLVIPVPVVLYMTARIIRELHRFLTTTPSDTTLETREFRNVRLASYGLSLVAFVSAVTLTPVLVSETIEVIRMLKDPTSGVFTDSFDVMWRVFHIIRMCNYSFNFYILMATGSLYREDMRRILCIPRETHDPVTVLDSVMSASNVANAVVETRDVEETACTGASGMPNVANTDYKA